MVLRFEPSDVTRAVGAGNFLEPHEGVHFVLVTANGFRERVDVDDVAVRGVIHERAVLL